MQNLGEKDKILNIFDKNLNIFQYFSNFGADFGAPVIITNQ
jgi:hypothetical protein